MSFENLPGIFDYKIDGNLGQLPFNTNPIVLVIGTAGEGVGDTPFAISTMGLVSSTFGTLGTLTRGIFEAAASGALNILAYRIGATPAVLSSIGGGGRVETVEEGSTSGTDYTIFYDD
ncbi:MAG TPA: hypothetical protein VKR58_15545, partial [Aquella sp.]|nr:hypothetical protein [Aquella sp.]